MILVGEIETVVVRHRGLPIEEFYALIVKAAAGVIIDYVRDHRDAVEMAEIDECLELIDLPGELSRSERTKPLSCQQPVHACHVRYEVRCRHSVIHFWRKEIRPVVAETVLTLIFLKRERHDGVDAVSR